MQLLLVRHGESTGNVTRVLQPADEPLTERGREQARTIAARLAARGDARRLYASPLRRAFETASIIGEAVGLPVEPDARFAEIDVGTAAGLTFDAWAAANPEEARRFQTEGVDYEFPGGESGRRLGTRTAQAIDELLSTHRMLDGAVVVVSHGGALAWAVSHLLHEPRDEWPRRLFDNCSLTEVTVDPDAQAVSFVCLNEISHFSPPPEEVLTTVPDRG